MTRNRTSIGSGGLHGSGAWLPYSPFGWFDCMCPRSNEGKGLLVLLPSETNMVPALQAAKIPLKQITINPKHATAATAKVRAEIAADAELKSLAQKSFKSYVKSVSLQPNKDVFSVGALPLDAYAEVRVVLSVVCSSQ